MSTEGKAQALDRAAMADLLRGKDSALNELMERHGQKLFSHLVRLLKSEAEAADVAQEAFARVYLHRHRFNPDFSFTTWLYTIASNLVKNRQRWFSRHPEVSLDQPSGATGMSLESELEAPGASAVEDVEARERGELFRKAIHALPEDLRRPLILAEYENFSHKEIGQILGCSAKAVETRIARARQRLRVALDGQKADLLP